MIRLALLLALASACATTAPKPLSQEETLKAEVRSAKKTGKSYQRLAALMLRQKRFAEGLRVAREGLEEFGGVELNGYVGAFLCRLQRDAEGARLLEQSVTAFQLAGHAELHAVAMECCGRTGRDACLVRASSEYLQTRSDRPTDAETEIIRRMAAARLRLGDAVGAVRDAVRLLTHRPHDQPGQALLHRATLATRKGAGKVQVSTAKPARSRPVVKQQ